MKKIIFTVIATILVIALGSFIYIESGSYDISQLTPHNNLTKWAIQTTKHKSIDKCLVNVVEPLTLGDSSMIIEGFRHYSNMCSRCHGAPGEKPDEMTLGLYPKPPLIYKHKQQEDPKEFFWIIKNGIKMTSMPAYGPTHADEKIWAIVAFVTGKLNKMTPDEYSEWVKKYENEEEMDTGKKDN
ncbi:MAG: cytochrome c [Saprospiraceae bacterium]